MVAAMADGDMASIATAFDRYAAGLYGYCRTLLADPAEAGRVVQDVFVIAASRAGRLSSAARLKPWLFALASNECEGRLQAGAAPVQPDSLASSTEPGANSGLAVQPAEFPSLVWAAFAAMDPQDREVIELSSRQQFPVADLADIIGVSRRQMRVLLAHAQARFEAALDVLLAVRGAPSAHCAEMGEFFDGLGRDLGAVSPKWVTGHLWNCPVCDERKKVDPTPAAALGLLPVAELATGQRQRTLRLIADASTAAANDRDRIVERAGPFGADGFPSRPGRSPAPRRQISYVTATAAAALTVALLGGGAVLVDMGTAHNGSHSAGQTPAVTAGPAGSSQPATGGPLSPPGSGSPSPVRPDPGVPGFPVQQFQPSPSKTSPGPRRTTAKPSRSQPGSSSPASASASTSAAPTSSAPTVAPPPPPPPPNLPRRPPRLRLPRRRP
jgi:RNA polymerase sigma factor (sigma-70 family)